MNKSNDDYQCRGSFALGSQCGTCSRCRQKIHSMWFGLWKIAGRAEDASSVDIRCYVADALGVTLQELLKVIEQEP